MRGESRGEIYFMKSDQEMKTWQLGGLNILQVLGCFFFGGPFKADLYWVGQKVHLVLKVRQIFFILTKNIIK